MGISLNGNIIMNDDVMFDGHDVKKHSYLLTAYPSYVRDPSLEVCELLGDTIKYANVTEIISRLENIQGGDMKLNIERVSPSIFNFSTFDEMILFLKDENYINYFNKCLCSPTSSYKLWVYQICNKSNIRNRKLEELGI